MRKAIHTHYDNLRIKRNATPGIIKAAYRALSVEYHPDKNPDRDTTHIMQMLNDAYAVLGDPVARAKYDAKVAAEKAAASQEAPPPPPPPPPKASAAPNKPQSPSKPSKPAMPKIRRPIPTGYVIVGGLMVLLAILLAALAIV
ncbi:J domain-containing protein [Candidatus Burkholderia verschuerenii]|uniref:J domain-containing protein n=1 Tax=Candidatus Burkholderia verschuerenii TaxID=242163 RepID=UPI00067AF193|nr:J domain-containing protein [Candidatus Burkholderia verschuerenii]